eukprot:PhM_4_TR2468/c1_g2_i3/m.11103
MSRPETASYRCSRLRGSGHAPVIVFNLFVARRHVLEHTRGDQRLEQTHVLDDGVEHTHQTVDLGQHRRRDRRSVVHVQRRQLVHLVAKRVQRADQHNEHQHRHGQRHGADHSARGHGHHARVVQRGVVVRARRGLEHHPAQVAVAHVLRRDDVALAVQRHLERRVVRGGCCQLLRQRHELVVLRDDVAHNGVGRRSRLPQLRVRSPQRHVQVRRGHEAAGVGRHNEQRRRGRRACAAQQLAHLAQTDVDGDGVVAVRVRRRVVERQRDRQRLECGDVAGHGVREGVRWGPLPVAVRLRHGTDRLHVLLADVVRGADLHRRHRHRDGADVHLLLDSRDGLVLAVQHRRQCLLRTQACVVVGAVLEAQARAPRVHAAVLRSQVDVGEHAQLHHADLVVEEVLQRRRVHRGAVVPAGARRTQLELQEGDGGEHLTRQRLDGELEGLVLQRADDFFDGVLCALVQEHDDGYDGGCE